MVNHVKWLEALSFPLITLVFFIVFIPRLWRRLNAVPKEPGSTQKLTERIYSNFEFFIKIFLALVAAFGYVRFVGESIKADQAAKALFMIGLIGMITMVALVLSVASIQGWKLLRWKEVRWHLVWYWQEIYMMLAMYLLASGLWFVAILWPPPDPVSNKPLQRRASSAASCSAHANGPAGIVLYYRDGDSVFLLLADHGQSKRGWGAFGGAANPGEDRRETAARETAEETRGYFSRDWLRRQIAEQTPVQSGGFSMYFVEVPFVPAQRVMNNPTKENDKQMHERGCYAWIPFSVIEPAIAKETPSAEELKVNPLYLPRGSNSDSLWGVWVRNMHDAMKQGAFPWDRDTTKTEQDGGEATSRSAPQDRAPLRVAAKQVAAPDRGAVSAGRSHGEWAEVKSLGSWGCWLRRWAVGGARHL